MQNEATPKASGFLVLKMKVGEAVMIGEDITLVVSERAGTRFLVAIRAPRESPIQRIPWPPEAAQTPETQG